MSYCSVRLSANCTRRDFESESPEKIFPWQSIVRTRRTIPKSDRTFTSRTRKYLNDADGRNLCDANASRKITEVSSEKECPSVSSSWRGRGRVLMKCPLLNEYGKILPKNNNYNNEKNYWRHSTTRRVRGWATDGNGQLSKNRIELGWRLRIVSNQSTIFTESIVVNQVLMFFFFL